MPNFIQISFQDIEPEQSEVLVAHLAEAGFEGFEEQERGLRAFIPEKNYDKHLLHELAYKYQLSFSEERIPEQNWNAVWESNFQPVIVDDFVAIRAGFHEPVKGVEQEIVITPKMSFGTGHHATTHMMIQQLREIDCLGKSVFDFGTGTGVLAILAAKLGAASVLAIDNDDWSIENAIENTERNQAGQVRVQKADSAEGKDPFDIILANINKNVILENLPSLCTRLNKGGILLLSGLLKEDETDITGSVLSYGLKPGRKLERNGWISLQFNR